MASVNSVSVYFVIFITTFTFSFPSKLLFAFASYPTFPADLISSISASPEFQPSPTPSPDISPLFPSPGPAAFSPSDDSSIFPTIPSSPSPPNPDVMVGNTAHPPDFALPPASSLPFSGSEVTVKSSVLVVLTAVSMAELFGLWW